MANPKLFNDLPIKPIYKILIRAGIFGDDSLKLPPDIDLMALNDLIVNACYINQLIDEVRNQSDFVLF